MSFDPSAYNIQSLVNCRFSAFLIFGQNKVRSLTPSPRLFVSTFWCKNLCPFVLVQAMPLFGLCGVISLPLCPGASPLAGSLPIWCWPSLPLVGGSHNWCIAIGTHPHMSHFSTLLATLFGAYWQPNVQSVGTF